jgi:hypothetical protein
MEAAGPSGELDEALRLVEPMRLASSIEIILMTIVFFFDSPYPLQNKLPQHGAICLGT